MTPVNIEPHGDRVQLVTLVVDYYLAGSDDQLFWTNVIRTTEVISDVVRMSILRFSDYINETIVKKGLQVLVYTVENEWFVPAFVLLMQRSSD